MQRLSGSSLELSAGHIFLMDKATLFTVCNIGLYSVSQCVTLFRIKFTGKCFALSNNNNNNNLTNIPVIVLSRFTDFWHSSNVFRPDKFAEELHGSLFQHSQLTSMYCNYGVVKLMQIHVYIQIHF